MEGSVSKIKENLFKMKGVFPTKTKQLPIPGIDPELLHEKTLQQTKSLFGNVIKLPASKIDENEALESYGIDSIMITQLNQKLVEVFGEITKTLFFEYHTLEALTEYLTKEYIAECLRWTGLDEGRQEPAKQETISLDVTSWPELKSFKAQKTNHRNNPISFASNQSEPIAIIGISGIYPQAENLEEYWENLKNGKSCISEIPSDRWNWKDYYRPKSEQTGIARKPYSKWGGFLKHWNQFDPLFFNLTPKDAENIDPQERLFLQESWKALEDAGYCPSHFSREMRKNIAVFAGITKQGFNLYFDPKETYFPTTSFSAVANRVSHNFNLQGTSMPIDTMCSSSLVAIHEACEYLRYGRGDLVIAGGVNMYIHPATYLGLSKAQLISSTEFSAAFSQGGDGFVPGEGVGVVILKPYSKAIKDKDAIYALIRGSAVNHNGRTNGYGLPNLNQQVAVIETAICNSGVDKRSISYIEAATSGSELGDVAEIEALI
ncbi:MAG: hypothetical protein GY941_30560, partial [Planctomycetes bacterium]|nr:hypothetical protein [Planctomycetota bacterium]